MAAQKGTALLSAIRAATHANATEAEAEAAILGIRRLIRASGTSLFDLLAPHRPPPTAYQSFARLSAQRDILRCQLRVEKEFQATLIAEIASLEKRSANERERHRRTSLPGQPIAVPKTERGG